MQRAGVFQSRHELNQCWKKEEMRERAPGIEIAAALSHFPAVFTRFKPKSYHFHATNYSLDYLSPNR
jgi:hypothetical protein